MPQEDQKAEKNLRSRKTLQVNTSYGEATNSTYFYSLITMADHIRSSALTGLCSTSKKLHPIDENESELQKKRKFKIDTTVMLQ